VVKLRKRGTGSNLVDMGRGAVHGHPVWVADSVTGLACRWRGHGEGLRRNRGEAAGAKLIPGTAQGPPARPPCGRLPGTVHTGGLLLAVYHDLDDEHREHMKSRGVDPADYVGADDLARLLTDDFVVELHAAEPRIDPPHIADVVLRARRR
jgi:hypothetical protein